MKDNRSWIFMVVWALCFGGFLYWQNSRNPQTTPPIGQVIAQEQKLERAAGTDTKKLKGVAAEYDKIGKNKHYAGTEEAADARLHAAEIYENKAKDLVMAEKTYTSLANDATAKGTSAAAEAKVHMLAIREKITDKHKNDIGYKAIDWLVALTGRNPQYSYALALLIITLVFKLITTPLSHAQYKSMREMQKIQPLVKQLQEKYKDQQQELGKKMMELYKEHGVNPLSGCLPLLVQMPILWGLYKYVILPYQFEFAKGEFLWIGSGLSKLFPKFVAANLSMPDIPLLVIYTLSMIVSQKLSMVDPSQGQEQKIMAYAMPVMFAFIFWTFPAAFMLYWLFFNVISTVQQYQILKHPSNTGGPTTSLPTNGGGNGKTGEEDQPKKSAVVPGNKARRRRRRFQVVPVPQSVLQPTPGG